MKLFKLRIVAVILCTACLVTIAQTKPAARTIHISDLMSASDFKMSGLSKLSPDELDHLDSWLNSYLGRLIVHLTQSKNQTESTSTVIESSIDGEFHGWSGSTIFKLKNGQIWQQAEYDYDYEYDYEPDVTIYKTDEGYKMQVKGVDDTIGVKRLK
jgi:hypothetical protein